MVFKRKFIDSGSFCWKACRLRFDSHNGTHVEECGSSQNVLRDSVKHHHRISRIAHRYLWAFLQTGLCKLLKMRQGHPLDLILRPVFPAPGGFEAAHYLVAQVGPQLAHLNSEHDLFVPCSSLHWNRAQLSTRPGRPGLFAYLEKAAGFVDCGRAGAACQIFVPAELVPWVW